MSFKKYLEFDGTIKGVGGNRKEYKFPNGFGASVISHIYSYGGDRGLWELAVTKDGSINYNTPITSDVIGYLEWYEVLDVLRKISELEEGLY